MSASVSSSGIRAADSGEQYVLLVGDDAARVDAFVSTLRRGGFSVRRAMGAEAGIKLVRASHFHLIAAVLPLGHAHELLREVRADGSPCHRTAVVLLADESLEPERLFELGALVNRVLSSDSPPEELKVAADELLNTAPRISVEGTARVHLGAEGEIRTFKLENISATGMLVVGPDLMNAGTVFGFELLLPALSVPIRGRGQVVRHLERRSGGEQAIAVSFVSFGGEGAAQLQQLVVQEGAAAAAKSFKAGTGAGRGVIQIRDADELAMRKEELAELTPYLEDLLRQGLYPRVKAAEWYATAAELGLESLKAFSGILEAIHGGRTRGRMDVSQQLADLNEVSKNLETFGILAQDLQKRVEILLAMRLSLERLLRALALTGAFSEEVPQGGHAARPKGFVSELALEIQRMLRSRRNLRQMPGAIKEMRHPKYIFARPALGRKVDEFCNLHSTWVAELGIDREALKSGRGRKRALAAVTHELKRLDQRLKTVHQKIFSGKFRAYGTDDLEADFSEGKLAPVLASTLGAGAEFLVRAYSAYRHALELTSTEPKILDRVAALAAAISAAEAKLQSGTTAGRLDIRV